MKKNKKQKPTKRKLNWVIISILILFVCVPTGIFTKLISTEIDPYLLCVLRYGLATLILLPAIINAFKNHRKIMMKSLPVVILISLFASLSNPLHVGAIASSSVSFVYILNLFDPILFAIISLFIVRDRITKPAVIGLLFAILGASVILALPLLTGEGAVYTNGWLPALMVFGSIITGGIWVAKMRKLDESGVPLSAMVGFGFLFTTFTSIGIAINNGGTAVFSQVSNLSGTGWLMLIYLAVVVSVVVRIVRSKAYNNIGTATYASTDYIYYIMAIAAPLVILGETISWEMIVGASLVIIGIIFTRFRSAQLARNKGG